jgi:hypothetical protein
MGEDTTMTVSELRATLASVAPESQVLVVLFKNHGTNEVFEREDAYANNGYAQREIHEDEPVAEKCEHDTEG